MTPTPGQTYVCRGFRFRVRFVDNAEVFVARFPDDNPEQAEGTLLRVSRDVWDREMAEAQEVNP